MQESGVFHYRPIRNKQHKEFTDLLREQYLPKLYGYVMYRVNDSHLAESITLKVLRMTATERSVSTDSGKLTMILFSAARRELQDLTQADVNPVFLNLSAEEREVLSLRLGAHLDARTISKILGLSPSVIRVITCRSLCKLESCTEEPGQGVTM
jgi:DNA-directed RNA polymerase specialized sigma24 family protein